MEYFVAIGSLFLGWLLNEISQYFRYSRVQKGALAHALSILLEVRFQVIYLECVIGKLKELGITDETIPQIRSVIESLMPNIPQLENEYEESIRIVSEHAPLTAYEYRSRASLSVMFRNFRNLGLKAGENPAQIEKLENELKTIVLPRLDEMVLDLSKLHSRKSNSAVKNIVETKFEFPESLENIFNSLSDS